MPRVLLIQGERRRILPPGIHTCGAARPNLALTLPNSRGLLSLMRHLIRHMKAARERKRHYAIFANPNARRLRHPAEAGSYLREAVGDAVVRLAMLGGGVWVMLALRGYPGL